MNRLILTVQLSVVVVSFACHSRSVTPAATPDPNVGEPIENPIPPTDPVTPVPSVQPVCAPLPAVYHPADLSPPAEALGDCSLKRRQRVAGTGTVPSYVVTYEWNEGELIGSSHYPKQGHTDVDRYRFDDAGRVIYMKRKKEMAIPHIRSYDDDGNLILDQSHYQTVKQRFQDGRLVERLTTRDNGRETLLRWTYDQAGRLSIAEGTSIEGSPLKTTTVRADWKYDSEGRPVQVIRQRDGEVYWTNRWTFGDNNALIKRVVIRTGKAGSSHYLDNYEGHSSPSMFGLSIVTSPSAEGCRFPGVGITDGYPSFHYDLGWTRLAVEEPEPNLHRWESSYAYHQLYGYSYYYYVPPIWVTHNLLSESWTTGLGPEGVVVEIDYNGQGEMSRESIYQWIEGMNEGTQKGDLLQSRQREFENGLLMSDRVNIGPKTVASGDEPAVQRTLKFGYDAKGHLLRRELWQDELKIGYQTWTFDEAGRHTGHTVFLPYVEGSHWLSYGKSIEGEFELTQHGEIGRAFDAVGRMSQSWERGTGGNPYIDWQYSYGEAGRVYEASQGNYSGNGKTVHRFDSQGQEVLTWYEVDGVRSTSTEMVYGAEGGVEGKLLSSTNFSHTDDGEKIATMTTTYEYTCF